MFIVRLNSEGAYQWHTFFGSTNDSTYNSKDFGSSIVIDSGNTLYVAGCSCAPWKGPEGQEPLHTFITTEKDGEGWISNNLFVLKLK